VIEQYELNNCMVDNSHWMAYGKTQILWPGVGMPDALCHAAM
jgi:hypothetical protein